MPRFRQSLSGPPMAPFGINLNSPQAQGLLAWFPSYPLAGNSWREFFSGASAAFAGATARSIDADMGHGITVATGSNVTSCPPHWGTMSRLTVTAWIRPTNVADTSAQIASAGGVTYNVFQWRLESTKLTAIPFNTLNQFTASTSTTALSNGLLYHVAFTWDSANIRHYINGVQDATVTARTGNLQQGMTTFGLGRYYVTASDFPGQIFDVRLYDRVLSPDEMWQHWDPLTRWELYKPQQRMWAAGVLGAAPPTGKAYWPLIHQMRGGAQSMSGGML